MPKLTRDPFTFMVDAAREYGGLAEGSSDRPRAAYYPFGMGQRMCIGSTLSLIEQQLTIAMIAQAYRRELVPGYELATHYDIALRPRDGVPMRLTRQH